MPRVRAGLAARGAGGLRAVNQVAFGANAAKNGLPTPLSCPLATRNGPFGK